MPYAPQIYRKGTEIFRYADGESTQLTGSELQDTLKTANFDLSRIQGNFTPPSPIISSRQGAKVKTDQIDSVIQRGDEARDALSKRQQVTQTDEEQLLRGGETYADSRGVLFYQDTNTPVETPADAVQSANGLYYSPSRPDAAFLLPPSKTAGVDSVLEATNKLMVANTEETNALIASLSQAWQSTRALTEEANRYEQGVYAQAGLRSGQARYSPEANASLIASVIRQGAGKLEAIDAKYTAAIAEAKFALNTKNYELALSAANAAAQAEKEAKDEAKATLKETQKIRADFQKKLTQVENENAVASLFDNGVIEAEDIQAQLALDGKVMSLKDIKDALDIVNPKEDLTGLSADIKTFKQFFPDVNITTEKGQQKYLDWQAAVARANREPKEEKEIKVDSKVESILIAAGLTADEISHINQGVRENGFESVYQAEKEAGASSDRLSALKEAYGLKKREQFLTTDYLADYYGDAQLKEDADAAGYRHILTGWETEKQNYLDYLMQQVELKRQAGMNDQEIFEAM